MNMASVEERLKLKRGQVDTWSTREKLCLASCVVRSGNQNWMSVSRNLKIFAGEPGRPHDWFSQKSCAVQYDNLLTQIETPKRKKRGTDGTKTEGTDTPADAILKQLTVERLEELKKEMDELRTAFKKVKEECFLVESGQADDRLDEMIQQINEEKIRKEAEQEENARWIRLREERKHEMELAWRPQQNFRNSSVQGSVGSNQGLQLQSAHSVRRASGQSEIGSEADGNIESPLSTDQILADEAMEVKPAPTPTSPLLTSLLKSPSPVTAAQSSSILHSAITSQRGASPTITSLLNSSPSIPNASTSLPVSPNLKSLVSNALAGHDDVPKSLPHTSSGASGSPTLSMLLELPPSTPGQPLPELPYSATKQPAPAPAPPTAPTSTDSTTVLKAQAAISAANKTEPIIKESLPDLGNVEIVLPIETEAKISEAASKLNLDPGELQDLSNSDLELVMDPSMDVVLEELVPEGLVEEMSVFIEVSSDDVETDVNNILDAAEPIETANLDTSAEQEGNVKKQMVQEILAEAEEDVEPVEASPKSALQPSEPEDKEENAEVTTHNESLSREALENASIVIVQDNGEVVKLQDGVESTQVMGDIQIVGDSANNDVVVVPLEDVSEEANKEPIPTTVGHSVEGEQKLNITEEEGANGASNMEERQPVEFKPSGRTPVKSEKQDVPIKDTVSKDIAPTVASVVNDIGSSIVKNIDILENTAVEKHPDQSEEISIPSTLTAKSEPIRTDKIEEIVKIVDPIISKEGKRRKSLSLQRKEKSPGTKENVEEVLEVKVTAVTQEPNVMKLEGIKEEEEQESKIESVHQDTERKSSATAENNTVQMKEEKVNRSDTPSTEDDKSRDAEQSTPVVTKPRRGRLGRDSAAYSDPVANSPTPSSTPTEDEKEYRVWKKSIMLVYGRIATHKNASIFLRPITDDKAPGYSQMIFRPIDLSTIKKNVETGVIRTTEEFQRDILIMFNNAIMYNKMGTPVHDMALEMQEEGVKHLKEYVTTQLLVRGVGPESGHAPSRRGTRTTEKREQDSDTFSSRRGLDRSSKGGTPVSTQLGKRKRSTPDDKLTPKRRKDED